LIPILVESLKEINLKLEALKNENEILKKKVGM